MEILEGENSRYGLKLKFNVQPQGESHSSLAGSSDHLS
jgi:hypothetical protein